MFRRRLSYLLSFSFGLVICTGIGSADLSAQATKQLKTPGKTPTRKAVSSAGIAESQPGTPAVPSENDAENKPEVSTGNQSYSIVVENNIGPDGKRHYSKKVWKNGQLVEETNEVTEADANAEVNADASVILSNGELAPGIILRSKRFGDTEEEGNEMIPNDPSAMPSDFEEQLQNQFRLHEQMMRQFPQFRGGPNAPHFPGMPSAIRPPHIMPPGHVMPLPPGHAMPPGGQWGGRPGFAPTPIRLSEYWIGAAVQPIPEPLAEQLDIPADQGVIVTEIVPNSPAEQAGLKRFDIITRIGDTTVNSVAEIGRIVDRDRDKAQQITYLRKGKEGTLELTPQPRLTAHPQQEIDETDQSNDNRRSIRIVRPGFIVPAPQKTERE